MSSYTLLTGATGLLGRFLVRDLLSRGCRLAVLVRPSRKETAQERVEAILQMWERESGRPLPRPVCLEGDVNQPGLGLKPSDREWAARHCDRIIHNAAALTFAGKDRNEDPWRTNLDGTRTTLDTCRELGILDMHYVSTAYVCGTRQGVIRENELECGQSFRNDYEHSKFLSEKTVREADFLKQLTVYRPVVIAGDSETGYTNTYHGLYTYLRLIAVLVWNQDPDPDGRRYTPVRLNMTGDEKRNIIPVDWTSAILCRLLETREAHGGTYHLAPKVSLTPREIIEAGYEYFNSYGVEFHGPNANAAGTAGEMDMAFKDGRVIYESYEASDPVFDTSNTDQFAADLVCPKIDEAMLHGFWKYGEEDRWGKRRPPKAEIPFWVDDELASVSSQAESSQEVSREDKSKTPVMIGLDIAGPGGGQWKVLLRGNRLEVAEKGLPSDAEAALKISTDDWKRLSRLSKDEAVDQLSACLETTNGLAIASVAGGLHEAIFSQTPKTCEEPACKKR